VWVGFGAPREFLRALEAGWFVPHFQPQFDARSLEIIGMEALARLHHPDYGVLGPASFLQSASDHGLVARLDEVILTGAIAAFDDWALSGLRVPRISVNVSASRLCDPCLIEKLERLSINMGFLAFEVLETISFEGEDSALIDAIERVKSLGIEIEIDDFGTGHASIVSLLELAPSRFKIDRRFTAPLEKSDTQRRLMAGLIAIGKALGIKVVAEGIESMVQADILRNLGCDYLQGFELCRPLSADGMAAFLAKYPSIRESRIAAREPAFASWL
jgi:EAL domain-containing protein (putative c-di-GMP-specific phosphodiesterase class I)